MGALGPFRRRLTALALAAAMSTATIPGADAQTAGDAAFPPAFPPYPTATRFVDLKLWIAGNTNLTYTQIILTSADSVFAFTDDGPLAQLDGTIRRTVREEVLNPDLAARLGGRSASAEVSFDCAQQQTIVDGVSLYPGNNLKGGDGQSIPAARWLTANTSLDLLDLAQAACGKSHPHPPATTVAEASPPAVAATPPTAPVGSAPSAVTVADAPPPVAAAPAAPVSSAAAAVAPTPPPAAAAPPAVAPASDGVWVQIGAFASNAMADKKWLAIQQRWPAGTQDLSERTETVVHDGKTLMRTLVGPFATRALAATFCTQLRARGHDCLVR